MEQKKVTHYSGKHSIESQDTWAPCPVFPQTWLTDLERLTSLGRSFFIRKMGGGEGSN